ncbi:MAG: putative PEP-binding protein, partial [Anaerolineae bacterium]
GKTGDVILNPSPNTLRKYRKLKEHLNKRLKQLSEEIGLPSITSDGHSVKVLANVGSLSDLNQMQGSGAQGIGLFRSEFLFLRSSVFLTPENEHFAAYKQAVSMMNGLPIVIRALDVGGDKTSSFYEKEKGLLAATTKGIRFLLRFEEVFKTQLRAILKASAFGDISILLPLVSGIEELRAAKKIIEDVKKTLFKEGVKFSPKIPVGCMIELPSAVITCDLLIQESDFISIGTNDLLQYSLGIDRNSQSLNHFHGPMHVSVIRMIKMVAQEAQRLGKAIAICGEIASNPLYTPLFLGLGVFEFSCASRYVPLIKKMVRQCKLADVVLLAKKVLNAESTSRMSEILRDEVCKMLPKKVFEELDF